MNLYILPQEYSGDPLALAMLQAFYSRSLEPIEARVSRLGGNMTSVKKALNTYFVGYGHASIGDCGFITVFIEGVSILAAKAVQDDPLYNGQECSTRYIELSGEGYVKNHDAFAYAWQSDYQKVRSALIPAIQKQHPFDAPEGFDSSNPDHTKPRSPYDVWKNATTARAFDIARAWIPCNALTNLSLTCSLRTANEVCIRLCASESAEIVELGTSLKAALVERFPEACATDASKDAAASEWQRALTRAADDLELVPTAKGNYAWTDQPPHAVSVITAAGFCDTLVQQLSARPKYAKIPNWIDPYATFTLTGYMDYGTWRDLQRHRRNIGRAPVLQPTWIHEWYTAELRRYLPEQAARSFIDRAQDRMHAQSGAFTASNSSWEDIYSLPLGTIVPYHYTLGLAQAIYFSELRSGNTVHPILRPMAQQLAECVSGLGIQMYYDAEPARFDLRRGTQTITEGTKP